MPRPRKKTFPLSDLKYFDTILSELQSMPEMEDFDIENTILTVKQRKPKYTAKPENIETAIKNLRNYIEKINTNRTEDISKQKMSTILGISRPTLDIWIEAEIIKMEIIGYHRGFEISTFTPLSMLRALEEQ